LHIPFREKQNVNEMGQSNLQPTDDHCSDDVQAIDNNTTDLDVLAEENLIRQFKAAAVDTN